MIPCDFFEQPQFKMPSYNALAIINTVSLAWTTGGTHMTVPLGSLYHLMGQFRAAQWDSHACSTGGSEPPGREMYELQPHQEHVKQDFKESVG